VDIDSFIDLHRARWKRLDETSRGGRGLARRSGPDIDEMVRLYVAASGDLAEVQTMYGDAELEAYLSGVVRRAHAVVYGTRPRTARGFVTTFGSKYREAVRTTLPYIGVATVISVAIAGAIALWVANSHGAQVGLLPPAAREAIRDASGGRRDLGLAPAALSTQILLNNVQVAILAFALGILFGVGTIYVLVQNAVLLGVLAGAFAAAGHAGIFWSLVLPHGLLELTAIFIAAGAGLRIGWSMIDPGDRPRSVALREETTGALRVLVGVIPAFVIAALIEGFVTGASPALAIGVVVWLLYLASVFGPVVAGIRRKGSGVSARG
jgi:uncharacterized membrane protein SpoIIM required for sporulation